MMMTFEFDHEVLGETEQQDQVYEVRCRYRQVRERDGEDADGNRGIDRVSGDDLVVRIFDQEVDVTELVRRSSPADYRAIEQVASTKMEEGEGLDHDEYCAEQEWRDWRDRQLSEGEPYEN